MWAVRKDAKATAILLVTDNEKNMDTLIAQFNLSIIERLISLSKFNRPLRPERSCCMARQKLTPVQEDQIREMRKAGKTPPECAAFMKTIYGINVPLWKISYITAKGPDGYVGKKKTGKQGLGGGPAKRHYRKHQELSHQDGAIIQVVPIEQATQDIIKGLAQIRAGYTAIFMHLRLAVIKEAGKVFKMAKEAGIEVKGEDVSGI